jgi:hypothetical protein
MRPVNKPTPPATRQQTVPKGPDGAPLVVMRMALQDTIGYYCSFCEMPINVTQAVVSKYVRQLKRTPTLSSWSDLLLACDFCQYHRTSDVTALDRYLWPDTDATFSLGLTSPFLYLLKDVTYVVKDEIGDTVSTTKPLVIVTPNLASPDVDRAKRTIDLFQLNTPFYDASSNTFTITKAQLQAGIDTRVDLRTEAWSIALSAIETLREARALRQFPMAATGVMHMAAGLAQHTGFWSVWMTTIWAAFADTTLIKDMLVNTDTRSGYQISGYQTLPDGGRPPWTIFTGTASTRVTA